MAMDCVGSACIAATAGGGLVVKWLIYALCLWEWGSEVSEEWVQDSFGPCMGNNVPGPMNVGGCNVCG